MLEKTGIANQWYHLKIQCKRKKKKMMPCGQKILSADFNSLFEHFCYIVDKTNAKDQLQITEKTQP